MVKGPEMTQQVVVITGAATGMGALTARSLVADGHIVYATMRDPEGSNMSKTDALRAAAKDNPGGCR
jgi:NAD(P)-dependent dehydrogenase (short-subunit alcohol dehydrogenase family)